MGPKKGANTLPKVVSPSQTALTKSGASRNVGKAANTNAKLPQVAGASPSPAKSETADPIASEAAAEAAAAEAAAVTAAAAATEAAAVTAAAAAEAAAAAAAAAEAAAKIKLLGNGMVKLIYEMYSEEFPIVDGSISSALIDETYCLSDVMPNCLIHLSKYDSRMRRALEDDPEGNLSEIFIKEEPRGIFHGLEKDLSFFVVIEQEAEQLKRDQIMQQRKVKTMEGYKAASSDPLVAGKKDDGRMLESCSCVYGNPCVDEYGCKDWSNRFAVAQANGWKGF